MAMNSIATNRNSTCLSSIISNQSSLTKVDNTQYLETRHGNKYLKVKQISPEQLEENEIILSIKNELNEFFRIDIVYCKDKIIHLIKDIRKHKWSSIHEIPNDYLIDIDRYELLKANQVNGVNVQNTYAQTLKEQLLKDKYDISIGEFRIQHTHNLPCNQGSYDIKKRFKNNLIAGITNYNIKQVNRKGRKGQIIGDIEDWNKEYDDIFDEDNDELDDQQEIEERKQDEEFLLIYLSEELQKESVENEKGLSQDVYKQDNQLHDYERELSQETTAVPPFVSQSSASPTITEISTHKQKGIVVKKVNKQTILIFLNSQDGKSEFTKTTGDSSKKQEKDKSFNRSKNQTDQSTNQTSSSSSSSSNSTDNLNNFQKKSLGQEIQVKKKIFLSEDSSDDEEDQINMKSASSNHSDVSDLDFQWITQGSVPNKIQVEVSEKQMVDKQPCQSTLIGGFNKKRQSQNNSQTTAVSNLECIALIDDEDDWEADKKFNSRQISFNAQPYKKMKYNVF